MEVVPVMKKAYPFILSVVIIASCLVIYACSLRCGSGVNFNVRTAGEAEIMSGNDSVEADRVQLFKGETVNINTADTSRFSLLPEIGDELSRRIVKYREENGCFESVEDIMKVEGIGEGRFEAIRDLITLSDIYG